MIPPPFYSLINTSIGGDPAVVVVNSALRGFEHRYRFPWHLRITIECKLVTDNGMPTSEEVAILESIEDGVTEALQRNSNATFLARVTCRGERDLIYRVCDPEVANGTLESLVDRPNSVREWDYRMQHDSDWTFALSELQLIERDTRIN